MISDRQLLRERRCYICLRQIPEGEGTYFAALRALLCNKACCDVAEGAGCSYDSSFRGRRRPIGEWKRQLRVMRPEAEKQS